MTEVSLRQDAHLPVFQEDPTGGRLVLWAQAATAAHQLARSLVRTSFVPDAFKTIRDDEGNVDPGNATAVIIMGDELGLSPLASLRNIYIFKGTPALYARTMRALALSHGHQMWNEKSTDDEVVVCGRRRGSDKIERASWTYARAKKAGYTSNQKYQTNPQEMLQAKADAEIARKIAADVLAGVPYSVEDLELEPPTDTPPAAPVPTVTKVSRARKPAEPAPIPEPDLVPEDAQPALDEPDEYREITKPQLTKMHACFTDRKYTRDQGLAFIAQILGFAVESSKNISLEEASLVINALEDEVALDA